MTLAVTGSLNNIKLQHNVQLVPGFKFPPFGHRTLQSKACKSKEELQEQWLSIWGGGDHDACTEQENLADSFFDATLKVRTWLTTSGLPGPA
jgi:hypothetical protein